MKKLWLTSLPRDREQVRKVSEHLPKYGLVTDGHFWQDDLPSKAWAAPLDMLLEKDVVVWLLLVSPEEWAKASIRFGLSLLALAVQARRGSEFPMVIINTDPAVAIQDLPTAFNNCEILPLTSSTLLPKIVALANKPKEKVVADYHFSLPTLPGSGQWFEVGPGEGATWSGALFGVCDGEIDAHGVGASGLVPEKAILEYPLKGLKLKLGGEELTAWAVQNSLKSGESYYVRVQGIPKTAVFGPHSSEEEADFYVIHFY